MFPILKIVIHCSATQNGKPLRNKAHTAAQVIDRWHAERGFKRTFSNFTQFNSHLKHIGYHYVIDTDGTVETGRKVGEVGAHVKGHNQQSIGICLVGGISITGKNYGRFTARQWRSYTIYYENWKANILRLVFADIVIYPLTKTATAQSARMNGLKVAPVLMYGNGSTASKLSTKHIYLKSKTT
ncbi:N-acetyl-anhydromuranmyl-L-alanine amidase [Pasteurella multocida subsp. gallicida str. Anand1_poultry]|nr:N-acetyl-anhydromuranmyl-L-alanine amidase [Pasteurella multocida subsp. gallicida str. Anand1_poultry]